MENWIDLRVGDWRAGLIGDKNSSTVTDKYLYQIISNKDGESTVDVYIWYIDEYSINYRRGATFDKAWVGENTIKIGNTSVINPGSAIRLGCNKAMDDDPITYKLIWDVLKRIIGNRYTGISIVHGEDSSEAKILQDVLEAMEIMERGVPDK